MLPTAALNMSAHVGSRLAKVVFSTAGLGLLGDFGLEYTLGRIEDRILTFPTRVRDGIKEQWKPVVERPRPKIAEVQRTIAEQVQDARANSVRSIKDRIQERKNRKDS